MSGLFNRHKQCTTHCGAREAQSNMVVCAPDRIPSTKLIFHFACYKISTLEESQSMIVMSCANEPAHEFSLFRKTLKVCTRKPIPNHGPNISDGMPEAGGGGASADTSANVTDAPEAATSDDDDGGDGDGEDDWRRSGSYTPTPSNGPAPLKRGIARNTGTRKAANTQPIDAMLWRLPTVLNHVPVSRSSWFAGVKSGRYPKPVQLGARAVAWRAEDIRTLVASFSLK